MRNQVGLMVIVVASVASAFSQTATIRATVVDSEGAGVGNAYVLLRTDVLNREHPTAYRIELRTNKEGEFTASVPAGFYDLFVGAEGFSPYAKEVRTRGENPQDIRVVMKIDELMLNEYGDRFCSVDGCGVDGFYGTPEQAETLAASIPYSIEAQPAVNSRSQNTAEVRVRDAATAISIAEPALIKTYGKRRIDDERPLTARLDNGIWTVAGTLWCTDHNGNRTREEGMCFGGTAVLKLRQSDGKILSIIHYK